MKKYTTVKISGVIICISKTTDLPGYTETILERLLPSDEELSKMSQKQQDKWTAQNNKFMEEVCELMNKHLKSKP